MMLVDEDREDLISEILNADPNFKMPKMVSTPERKRIQQKRFARASELRKLENSELRELRDQLVN